MRPSCYLWVLVFLPATLAYVPASTNQTDRLALKSRRKLTDAVQDGSLKRHLAAQKVSQDCKADDITIRQE